MKKNIPVFEALEILYIKRFYSSTQMNRVIICRAVNSFYKKLVCDLVSTWRTLHRL